MVLLRAIGQVSLEVDVSFVLLDIIYFYFLCKFLFNFQLLDSTLLTSFSSNSKELIQSKSRICQLLGFVFMFVLMLLICLWESINFLQILKTQHFP